MGNDSENETKILRRAPERGGSDLDTLWLVLIIVTLCTIGYLILGWVKSTKDEKVLRQEQMRIDAARQKRAPQKLDSRAPSGHQVVF